jgi:CheY-like chemotaxis protein
MDNKIVVIDDDKDILDVIQFILAEEGYSVVVYDRLESLEKIAEQKPSVILLDYKLGGTYSTDFCLSLKSDPLTKYIPVILVSASDSLEQITKQCNADAFLSKPFDLKDFIKIVKHYADSNNPASYN